MGHPSMRKGTLTMQAKRIAAAAAGGTLGLVALPLAAMASTAPVGSAAGTAVTVGSSSAPVAGVSSTSANSGSSSSGSSADVLDLGGNTVIGGSSSDGNNASGNVVDTGSAAPAEVSVAPYSATSTQPANGGSSSEGKAAVARVQAGSVSANVAQSDSKAQYTTSPDGTTTKSGGSTSTDGLTVDAPGLSLDVLHSDASSSGQGNAYLLGINGTEIGNSSQLQSICQNLSVPSVLSLSCVSATGGAGNLFEEVLGGVLGPQQGGIPATLFGSGGIGGGAGNASGGAASPAVIAAGTPANGANNGGLSAAPSGTGTASNAPGGHLPFTGGPIALWLLASVALVGLGTVTVKTSSLVVPRLYS